MKRFVSFLVLSFILISCSQVLTEATLEEFTADKSTITLGESITLSWSGVSSGTSLSLSPGFIDVTGMTSYKVTPERTTNYTLRITSNGGANWYTKLVTVLPPNEVPIAENIALSTPANQVLQIKLAAQDADNNVLSYSLVTKTSSGALSELNTSTGELSYTPNKDFSGTDSFTYKANDGREDSSVATVTLTVTKVQGSDTTPNANPQTLTRSKNTVFNIVLTSSNAQNARLSYTLKQLPLNGSVSNFNAATGALSYTPKPDFVGTDSFTFTVSNGLLESTEASISLTIQEENVINTAPTAQPQSTTTNEDSTVSITLEGQDAENDILTYSIVTVAIKGAITQTGNSVTYTPNPNSFGSDSFSFKVNDGSSDSNTATVSITVTSVNDAPVATSSSRSTTEDTAVSISLNASDVDGDVLSYSIVTSTTQGSLSDFDAAAGTLTYTPNPNYSGDDSFSFKASDGTTDSNVAMISLNVGVSNDAPVANAQSLSLNEDSSLVISLSATDADGDGLSYSLVSSVVNGSLSGTAPNLSYTPNLNFSGSDSFSFKVNDGTEDSNVATISLTINSVNDTPVATGSSLTTNEDTALNIMLNASDSDADTLSYTVVSSPSKGSLTGAAPNLTYTPNANVSGNDSFSFKVNDGTTDSNTATINLSITELNDKPVANTQTLSTNEDTDLSITLTGTDEESSNLSYTVLTNPSNGSLFGTVPTLTYRPSPNYFGDDSFSFKVNDGELDSDTATISITVDAVNDLPTADAQSLSTDKNTNLNITLTGNDLESSSLTYAIVTNPSHGLLSGSGANRSYTPNTNFTGADSFMFKVNDGTDDSLAVTISIMVAAPTPPSITSFRSTKTLVNAGETVTFSWAINSADGDAVRCTLDVGGGTTYAISDCVNTTSQTHTYSSAGFFTANLIASDDDGSVTSNDINMTVATSSSSDFSIQIVFVDENMTASQKAAFTNAAARWAEIITGDLSDLSSATRSCRSYPQYSFTGAIDDVVIMAAAPALDGIYGTLGSAGPCGLRSGPFPTYGLMRFDIADIANLESRGSLEDVILHEMGHVLGIGTLWGSLINTTAHTYSGTNGVAEYSTLKGSTQTTVPIEDGGGSGTANGHWEEDVFDHELMTGYLNSGVSNPISRQTIAALDDLGYTVDYSAADSYSLPAGASLRAPSPKIKLHSDLIIPIALEPDSGH